MSVDLTKEIWSETALAELLGATRKQVRALVLDAGLPGRALQRGLYVFLADDVLQWIKRRDIYLAAERTT